MNADSLLLPGVVVALALFAAGCSLTPSREFKEQPPLAKPSCATRAGLLTPAKVAAALGRQVFKNVVISRDCLTSIEYAQVDSGQLLFCSVYDPSTSWGKRIRTQGPGTESEVVWSGIKAYSFFENLECQLYPDKGQETRQMARLVAALRQLKANA